MIQPFEEHTPTLQRDVFVAHNALVLGQVELGAASSIWYGCVLRGDVGRISIGARTNIQDVSVIHVTSGTSDTTVGDDVTVGHRVILHGCTIANLVLVGMGAVVMDNVEVGSECIIGAGTLLPPGKRIPPGSLVTGSPGRVVRALTDEERQHLRASSAHYVELAKRHAMAAPPRSP